MISYYKNINGKVKGVKRYSKGSWIKIVNPNQEEIDSITKKFKLDADSVNDGLDLNEIPRIEKEPEGTYVYLRMPTGVLKDSSTATVLTVFTKDDVITISQNEIELYNRIGGSSDFNIKDQENFLIRLLQYTFNRYSMNVRRILKEVKNNKRNLSKLRNQDILDLVLREDILNDYTASLYPMIGMYNKILKLKILNLDKGEKEEIEDLIIDLNQTYDTCRSANKTITNMRDYYSSTVSNKINNSITLLTIFTVFLTIPAVISSIYGMNVTLPFQQSGIFFWGFIATVGLIWIGLFLIFKKMMNN